MLITLSALACMHKLEDLEGVKSTPSRECDLDPAR